MNTTYDQGTEMNELDAIEIIEWASHELRKPVLSLIRHLMRDHEGGYTIHVFVTPTRTIVHLHDYDGSCVKSITFRHWLDHYCGAQVIGGIAYTYCNDQWVDI